MASIHPPLGPCRAGCAVQEIKGLKAAVSKLQGAARQREDLLADKTGLAERLQVGSSGWVAGWEGCLAM